MAGSLDTDATVSVKDESLGQGSGHYPQVRSMHYRVQERARRRPTDPFFLCNLEITDPTVISAVEVGSVNEAALFANLFECLQNLPLESLFLDQHLALIRMVFVGASVVVL